MKYALATCLLVATTAHADDLLKQGLEQYRAGKYAQARDTLAKAYEQDKKPDTLFSLAQAERLAGDCRAAIGHYHSVLEQVPDLNVAKLVQQSLALCGENPPPAGPVPKCETKSGEVITMTKVESRTDNVAVGSLAGGIGGIAIGGGLFVAATGSRSAADQARTLDDHDALQRRANVEQTIAVVAAGLGVGFVAFAVYRWTIGAPKKTEVALVPTGAGGSLIVRW